MGLGLCLTCGSGCLVTDQIPFEEAPLEPPVILNSPTSPRKIGYPFFVDKTKSMWTMQVTVREKNSLRPLAAHVRIVDPEVDDALTPPPSFDEFPVPTGGVDPELRDLTFQVQTASLKLNHCHRLELAVSGHFLDSSDPLDFSKVARAFKEDLATAVWGVWEGKNEVTEAQAKDLLDSCKAATDLLGSGTTSSEVGQ